MKKNTENFMMMLLPVTLVAAIVFTIIATVAFNMESPTAGFTFTTLAAVFWIGLLVEFFLLYEAIVDRWFSRDRSVIAAIWFVVSIVLAFTFTPDKNVDWHTVLSISGWFCVLFFIPYIVCLRYAPRLLKKFRKAKEPMEDIHIQEALNANYTPSTMQEEEERKHYDELIAKISPEIVSSLPEKLQNNDALFLLTIFREDGYLDSSFMPTIMVEDGKVNQTLYAYIADAISSALKMKMGKWPTFETFWSIGNCSQLVTNFRTKTREAPTDHQRRISRLMRKASRLRPRLDTAGIAEFKKY